MHGSHAYRKNAVTGWTRIEMLLAIYDKTIASIDEGIDVLNRRDMSAMLQRKNRTLQLLVLLLDGIDADRDATAARIRDLCVFCVEQVSSNEIDRWNAAREVLATLREGFAGIRDEAIALEARGAIPSLNVTGVTVGHL